MLEGRGPLEVLKLLQVLLRDDREALHAAQCQLRQHGQRLLLLHVLAALMWFVDRVLPCRARGLVGAPYLAQAQRPGYLSLRVVVYLVTGVVVQGELLGPVVVIIALLIAHLLVGQF